MKKIIRFYSIILIIFLCLNITVPPGTCKFNNGYTVEPASPDMFQGEHPETVQVDFWELPPGLILLSLAFSLSGIFCFPVELFIIAKMLAFLGYRKISRTTVFNNEVRNGIYISIQENPGIFFNELMRKTRINRGSLRYHLTLMSLTGRIITFESAGNPRYFDNSRQYPEQEKAVLSFIRNETDCQIFRLLLEKPGLSRDELGEYLGLGLSTVSWRMKRLINENLVSVQRTGKIVQYGINPLARYYLEKHLAHKETLTTSASFEQAPEPA
jgi:predicted transcriptional regulator